MALKAYLKDDSLDVILEQPNNILGIEYIKALYKKKSSIKTYTIKRMVSGYHDEELTRQLQFRVRHPQAAGLCQQFHPSGGGRHV